MEERYDFCWKVKKECYDFCWKVKLVRAKYCSLDIQPMCNQIHNCITVLQKIYGI